MIFELLVIIVVALCGYIPWLYWRFKTPTPDMISEKERLSRELQAMKGELQVKDTELQIGREELQSRDTTISALEKKVEKVEDEKNRRLETVVNVLFKHRDFLEASTDFKYKRWYDGAMSDLRTRLEEVEEAYLAKCRALTAVTVEYSQVVAFASSNGTIPPPDEPTLARILMEYQEEITRPGGPTNLVATST